MVLHSERNSAVTENRLNLCPIVLLGTPLKVASSRFIVVERGTVSTSVHNHLQKVWTISTRRIHHNVVPLRRSIHICASVDQHLSDFCFRHRHQCGLSVSLFYIRVSTLLEQLFDNPRTSIVNVRSLNQRGRIRDLERFVGEVISAVSVLHQIYWLNPSRIVAASILKCFSELFVLGIVTIGQELVRA
jgi:hypothetical protein